MSTILPPASLAITTNYLPRYSLCYYYYYYYYYENNKKTIPLVARGPSLVESCHAKWRLWIAAQWLTGVISTGQTHLRFGSVRFSLVYFGRVRGQNHVRFTLVQYGVCWYCCSDWQPLEQVCRLSLLLELWGDSAPQLSKEVNSRFIDRSQCLYSDSLKWEWGWEIRVFDFLPGSCIIIFWPGEYPCWLKNYKRKLQNSFGSEPTLAGRHQQNHHAAKPN